MNPLKTRLAPTPSGFIHLGNAFNFIATALVAHLCDARILLRVDDLDQARYRREYADDIFQTLELLGLAWDEGPGGVEELEKKWSQHHRLPLYQKYLQKLADKAQIFACECSRTDIAATATGGNYQGTCIHKQIPLQNPGYSWRLFTDDQKLTIHHWDGTLETNLNLPAEMRHFVVRRRDGLPSYQITSLADDLFFGCNLLVRGSDLRDSSLAQLFLASRMEEGETFSRSLFFHHWLLEGKQGDKLSKSVLHQSYQLRHSYSAKEIYRAYSRFMKLEKEYDSLAELKNLVSEPDLWRLSKS